jgi:hypothetical protein
MQETDQNYSLYKSVVRENLRNLLLCCFDLRLTCRITDLPLLVFGGKCPCTGLKLQDALSEACWIARNLSCWRKCGVVPLTMASIHSGEIRHQIPVGAAAAAATAAGVKEEEGIAQLKSLEQMNQFYCDYEAFQG